jgi:hypothetical protein
VFPIFWEIFKIVDFYISLIGLLRMVPSFFGCDIDIYILELVPEDPRVLQRV